jgi:Arf-GAP/GTPase/ANK repeat/PH domain-containing protein 1/3
LFQIDCDGYEFQIVSLDNKIWHFEAASVEEREEWVTSIEHQILSSLQGNESSKSKSRMNSLVDAASIQSLRSTVIGNANCADCDAPSKFSLRLSFSFKNRHLKHFLQNQQQILIGPV